MYTHTNIRIHTQIHVYQYPNITLIINARYQPLFDNYFIFSDIILKTLLQLYT